MEQLNSVRKIFMFLSKDSKLLLTDSLKVGTNFVNCFLLFCFLPFMKIFHNWMSVVFISQQGYGLYGLHTDENILLHFQLNLVILHLY